MNTKKKEFILQKDIVIPAGTVFDNHSNQAQAGGYFECVVGIGKDYAEFFRINDMQEVLRYERSFFKEKVPDNGPGNKNS